MSEMTERPLVTFAVIAYNQERFIREAIEGAFAQTYEPLEIILSDDCSPDRTFEIMEEMAAAYDGPHTVRLNQNEHNLGLLEHLNRIERLSTSDIIILAAGDDISWPSRAGVLAAAFQENSALTAVFSEVTHNDERQPTGQQPDSSIEKIFLKTLLYYGGGAGIGASYAYKRECFRWPWPLPADLISEDRILPLRAALLGQVGRINHPLLLYRKEDTGLFSRIRREGKSAILYQPHFAEVERTLMAARDTGQTTPDIIADARRFLIWRHRLAQIMQKRGNYGDVFFRVAAKALDTTFNSQYRDHRLRGASPGYIGRLSEKIRRLL